MEKKKEITMFWGILIVFIATGAGVIIAAINNVGIFITGIIGLAFSYGVYKLPDFFVENRRNSPSLIYICSVGSVMAFLCLVGMSLTIQIQNLRIFELNRIQMTQCVLAVVYFLTALVVSKKIQQEEEKIGNDPTRSRSVH